eukprot:COSAG02_NODE_34671_length_480_cov_1.055118_1_plen_44_part_01
MSLVLKKLTHSITSEDVLRIKEICYPVDSGDTSCHKSEGGDPRS